MGDDKPHPSDKTVRFTLYWRPLDGSDETEETYEKSDVDPEKWSRDIIDYFNSTLRPYERKRVFVRCKVLGEFASTEHKWIKLTGAMSIPRHGQTYDGMRCERCGVTGKRFGLSATVKLDSRFSKPVFRRCDTARVAAAERELIQ